MAIPSGVILIWTGTHATIPSGWSRETTLDDKYPKAWGASVAPNVTGGANTHTHTGSHTHTMNAHNHTFSIGANKETDEATSGSGIIGSKHSHGGSGSTNASSGGGLVSNGTWASVNQEPPYYKVIFVKPTGTVAALPANICAHYYGTTAPASWNFCDGTNSTPDLRNKYLKGAGTGADAGAGSGGTTHVHNISHTHTVSAHAHTGQTNSDGEDYGSRQTGSHENWFACTSHYHTVYASNVTSTASTYTNTTAGGDTVEPAYKKLGVIKATVGAMRKGMVGLWLGATASIPNNWVLCDGNNGTHDLRDKFIKIGATLAENNATGGANTHTHSAVSHTHTGNSHTHTFTHGQCSNFNRKDSGTGGGVQDENHGHALTNGSYTTTVYSTDNMTADTVDNQPAYRTVAYIQLDKLTYGGSHLLNFL